MDVDVVEHADGKRKCEDEENLPKDEKCEVVLDPGKESKWDMMAMMRLRAICLQNEPLMANCDSEALDGVEVMVANIDFAEDFRWFTGGTSNSKKRTNRGHLVNGAYVQGEDLLEDVNNGGLEHLRIMGADEALFNGAKRFWRRRDDVGCARLFDVTTIQEMCCEKPGPIIPRARDSSLDGTGGGNAASALGRTRPNAFHRGKASTHQALPRAISKMGRFVVRRSGISTLGVYTSEAIPADELLMEYVGEVVRREVAELREKNYKALGLEVGCYLFSLGPEWLIDATTMGNMARYINHSCEPNCIAQLVTPGGKDSKGAAHHRRVFVYAKKSIKAGEELSYDYKLSTPDVLEGGGIMGGQVGDSGQIVCSCGAKRCRGSL